MKRLFIYITLFIMLLMTVVITVSTDKQYYEDVWENFGKSSSSINIYLNDIETDYDTAYNILTETADKYDANIYRSDNEKINENNVIVKSVYITHFDNVYNKVPIDKGHIPDNNELLSGTVLKTDTFTDNENITSCGVLYSYLNSQNLKIQSLKAYLDSSNNICGSYVINFEDISNSSGFIKEIAQKLNKNQDEITLQRTYYKRSNSTLYYIMYVIYLTALGLFFLLSTFFIVKQFKKIGIYKILGYDNMAVWNDIFLPFLKVEIVISALMTALIRIMTNVPRSTLIHLCYAFALTILLTFIVSLVFYGLIRRYTISSLIKKKSPANLIVKLNFVVRSILLIAVSTITLSAVNGFAEVKNEYRRYSKWEEYGKKYAVFNFSFLSEDHSDIINNTHLREQKQAELYDLIDDSGAAYVKLLEIYPKKSFVNLEGVNLSEISDNYRLLIMNINNNYLDTLTLKDIEGNVIKIDSSEESGIILIPESKATDETLKNICSYYRPYTVNSSERYAGEKIAETKNKDTKILYYQDNKSFFTFSNTIKTNDNYTINSPVFNVITTNNATFLQKSDILGSNETSPLKIDISNTTPDAVYNELYPLIVKCGLDKNIDKLSSISSIFEDKIKSIKKSIVIYFGVSIILFMISIWVSYQTVKMIINLNKKKFGVKILLGYTFFDNYRNTIVPFLLTWIIIMLISGNLYLSMNDSYEYSTLQLFICSLIEMIDVSLTCLQFKYIGRTSLSVLLKEE